MADWRGSPSSATPPLRRLTRAAVHSTCLITARGRVMSAWVKSCGAAEPKAYYNPGTPQERGNWHSVPSRPIGATTIPRARISPKLKRLSVRRTQQSPQTASDYDGREALDNPQYGELWCAPCAAPSSVAYSKAPKVLKSFRANGPQSRWTSRMPVM